MRLLKTDNDVRRDISYRSTPLYTRHLEETAVTALQRARVLAPSASADVTIELAVSLMLEQKDTIENRFIARQSLKNFMVTYHMDDA